MMLFWCIDLVHIVGVIDVNVCDVWDVVDVVNVVDVFNVVEVVDNFNTVEDVIDVNVLMLLMLLMLWMLWEVKWAPGGDKYSLIEGIFCYQATYFFHGYFSLLSHQCNKSFKYFRHAINLFLKG